MLQHAQHDFEDRTVPALIQRNKNMEAETKGVQWNHLLETHYKKSIQVYKRMSKNI